MSIIYLLQCHFFNRFNIFGKIWTWWSFFIPGNLIWSEHKMLWHNLYILLLQCHEARECCMTLQYSTEMLGIQPPKIIILTIHLQIDKFLFNWFLTTKTSKNVNENNFLEGSAKLKCSLCEQRQLDFLTKNCL